MPARQDKRRRVAKAQGGAIAVTSDVLPEISGHLLAENITYIKQAKRYKQEPPKEENPKRNHLGEAKDDDGRDYNWVVKCPDLNDPEDRDEHDQILCDERVVAEKLGSEIIRYFLGERAAKVRLVVDKDKKELRVASRMIASFQDLFEYYQATKDQDKGIDRGKRCDAAIKSVDGMYEVVAASIFAGGPDMNDGNLGVITNADGSEIGAIVDFNDTCIFNFGHRKYTGKHIEMKNHRWVEVTANMGCNKDDVLYTPADAVRFYHTLGTNVCDRSLLICQDFVEAIDGVVNKYNANPQELASIASKTVKSICKSYKEAKGEDLHLNSVKLPCMGEGVTLGNLGDRITNILQQRIEQMQDLSLAVKIQLAVGSAKNYRHNKDKIDQEIKQLVSNSGHTMGDQLIFLPTIRDAEGLKPRKVAINQYARHLLHENKEICRIM